MTPQQQLRPAAPAKLIVFFAFMIQFIALLLGLGGLVPFLSPRAANPLGPSWPWGQLPLLPSSKWFLVSPSGKFRSAAGAWTGRVLLALVGGPLSIGSIARPAEANVESSSVVLLDHAHGACTFVRQILLIRVMPRASPSS